MTKKELKFDKIDEMIKLSEEREKTINQIEDLDKKIEELTSKRKQLRSTILDERGNQRKIFDKYGILSYITYKGIYGEVYITKVDKDNLYLKYYTNYGSYSHNVVVSIEELKTKKYVILDNCIICNFVDDWTSVNNVIYTILLKEKQGVLRDIDYYEKYIEEYQIKVKHFMDKLETYKNVEDKEVLKIFRDISFALTPKNNEEEFLNNLPRIIKIDGV